MPLLPQTDLEKGCVASLHAVACTKTSLRLVGVAVSCRFPIGVLRKLVAKHSRSKQSKRKPLAVGGVGRGCGIAGQRNAIAIRMLHPVVARIKTGQRSATSRAGVEISQRSVSFRGLTEELTQHGFTLQAVTHRLWINKVGPEPAV